MKQLWISWLTLLMFGVACAQTAEPMTIDTAISGKLTPPAGSTLLILGQDNDSVHGYLAGVDTPVPAGFTSYTSLTSLHGLDAFTEYGAGPIYLDQLLADHPHSVIALGLHMVDYLDEINSGAADENIDRLLDYLVATERPVYLRVGYEVDGEWNHYEPDAMIGAWERIHTRMVAKGVENVALVWQVAAACEGTYRDFPIERWYPGDEIVDWIAFSYFTQADCDFEPIETLLAFARTHQKPVMIAEAAPRRYDLDQLDYSVMGTRKNARTAEEVWQEWFVPFFKLIEEESDLIRAVAYINADWDSQAMWGPPYTANGYWGDSRIEVNAEIQSRWEAEMGKPMWIFGEPNLLRSLQKRN